jgi:hypothetical protein
MLKNARLAMLRLTRPGKTRPRHWGTAIVLLAVCALAISVATRYGSAKSLSTGSLTVVQKHQSPTPGQRLLDNAATWMPPFVEAAIFQNPGYYPQLDPSDAPAICVLLERNLYNRPPPSLFLS